MRSRVDGDETSVNTVAPESVRELVDDLANRARVPAPRAVVARAGGLARLEGRQGQACLRVDRALLDAPSLVQRGVVAHEIAHLALEHRGRVKRRIGGLLSVLIVVAAIGAAVGTTVAQRAQLALVGAGTVFLAGRVLVARSSRQDELAADRYALDLLGGSEAALHALAWQRQSEQPEDEWWFARHTATHPSLAQRVAALHQQAAYDDATQSSEGICHER